MRVYDDRVVSFTTDQKVAERFSRRSDGSEYIGRRIDDAVQTRGGLSYPINAYAPDGPWFVAPEMEYKWNIYHHQNALFFVRSWTGDLAIRAATKKEGMRLHLTEIDASRTCLPGKNESTGPDEQIRRQVDFLVKSHLMQAEVPAPVPSFLGRYAPLIADYCFSVYGKLACYASPGGTLVPEITGTIRVPTPLHEGAYKGDSAAVAKILADGVDPNTQDNHGRTPLLVAALANHQSIVELLLARGATCDLPDDDGATAVHWKPVMSGWLMRT